jgi:hypothetical protein
MQNIRTRGERMPRRWSFAAANAPTEVIEERLQNPLDFRIGGAVLQSPKETFP